MKDNEVEPNDTATADPGYEPPAVIDFGTVFDITHGSADGGGDQAGQRN